MKALRFRPHWGPTFDSLNHAAPHPDGVAAASTPTDATSGVDQDLFFVLLADDGTVHVSAPAVRPYGHEAVAPEVVSPGQLLETMHGAVALAGYLATEHTSYQGPWRAGVLVTRLRGLLPSQAHSHIGLQRFLPYPSDEYATTTQTSTREMAEETATVVERLAKGFAARSRRRAPVPAIRRPGRLDASRPLTDARPSTAAAVDPTTRVGV